MVKLRNFRTFLVLSATLLFVVYFALWKFSERPVYCFKVKILPLSVWDDAPPETFYWERQKFLFPQINVPEPLPKSIPKSDPILYISLDKSGKAKFDSKDFGGSESITSLSEILIRIFVEREKQFLFEPIRQLSSRFY